MIFLTSAIILLVTSASYLIYEYFAYREITVLQLRTVSDIIAANATAALAFSDAEAAREILEALRNEENITKACLFDSTGRVFATYPDTEGNFPIVISGTHEKFESDRIEMFTPVVQGEQYLGSLFVSRGVNDLYERIALYCGIALAVIMLSFFVAYLLAKRFQEKVSGPIVSLAETTREVSLKYDYSIRAKRTTDDEIGVLTDAFNRMLGQIEIQNHEIQLAKEVAQRQALELEKKVQERTKEYKAQKDFAESILNNSLVLIAVFDRHKRILAFNNKCEEEFGLSREQVIGKPLDEAIPGSVNSRTYKNLIYGISGKAIHTPEYRSVVTGRYYESFMIPLRDERNEVYAVLLTAHNITDIVESREKVKQTNLELIRKNSELEQFAYVASHDLQEPLRKIQTFIQLVKRDLENPVEAGRYLEKIETSAKRMSTLIRDVLEYSRLSQIQESFTDVNLNIVLEYVFSDMELLISQKGAVVKHDSFPTMKGNRLQLHQLFANLLSNSLKFSTDTPEISITLEPLNDSETEKLQLDPSLSYIKILFSDNGIGFEQEYADKVFTIFQRLNTREKFEGTGIGLALCKKIVENHFGHISARSTPGVGTTFSIVLPLDAKNTVEAVKTA